jgi:haloalkane dehalogenase
MLTVILRERLIRTLIRKPDFTSNLNLERRMASWKELYPFESQYLEIPKSETSTETVRMHYVQTGPADAEQTILCVHGNPTWSFMYRRILTDCSQSTRVLAVDHIGCGLSDKPQKYPYTLERHVGNLARLIEQLDLQRVLLLVHDWGGAIGFGAALKLPTRVDRFVILNTAAFPPPYIPARIAACRIPWMGNFAIRRLNLFARLALSMAINRLPALEPQVAAGLLAPYSDWNSRIAIARFVQDIPTRKGQATWQALTSIEQRLGLFANRPIRIAWGMQDWCFRPECLERFQQIFREAKVNKLNDVGHYVMEEAPDEVISTVQACLDD